MSVDTRARVATSGAFAAQGFALMLLLTNLVSVQERYGVDEDTISTAILGVLLAAALGTWIADRVARSRGGSRVALAAGLALIAVFVPVIAIAPTFPLGVAAFALYGVALGMVDASTNMQAVAVQRAYGRPLLSSFYAAWSVGGIAAALLSAVDGDRLAIEPVTLIFLAATPVAALAAVLVARNGRRSHDAAPVAVDDTPGSHVPWRSVGVLAVAVVAYFAIDNGTQSWSTTYLEKTLDAASWMAPLGAAAYLGTTLLSRLVGDAAVLRWGRVRVVRAASLVGAAGFTVVVVAPVPFVAIAGFALAGAGLGLIAPLCFATAGVLAPEHADAVVARLNVFNYVGTLLGAVLLPVIGTATSFRLAFVLPILLALVVASIAGGFAGRTGTPTPVSDRAPDPAPRKEIPA
ncbi:MFS transporter [Cellulomonas rhizosphaerae]|uniref:MFS transporter n=1 Tax=Cellulomonas rhizosphaerae TaxID=2293719 RepID=A0A413RLK6_9CELL|nr:MFS transporter [Cellulomonas rhizosphaerae]RHA40962.1 MFS transporter [Cellulomonas rhizosphaerae]